MPDAVTWNMSDTGDIDALAAEYVLGTLDADERAQTQAMLAVDQALAAKVRIWERRLSELYLMVEPIEPDGEIWDRIKSKMTLMAASPPPVPVEPVVEPGLPPAPTLEPPAIVESPEAAASKGPDTIEPAGSVEIEQIAIETSEVARIESETAADSTEAAKAVEAELAKMIEATKPTETGETVEAAGAGEAVGKAEKPPVDEEPTPSGVFDDMPEPTPAGPLTSFPAPFTAGKPAVTPLTPAPPATLSVPVPPPVAPPSPSVAVRPSERRTRPAPPPKSRWFARTVAWLLTLVVLALAVLVAAWRFVPDRVPPQWRPVEVLRSLGIALPVAAGAPVRRPAPPESRYEE